MPSDVQIASGSNPVLRLEGARALTNSLDVAAFFGKAHRDVLRAVDKLLTEAPECLRNFAQGSYALPNTGPQQHRCFDMDRSGFTLLAMGFTGAQALKFKLAYIAAFDAMEERLRQAAAVVNVRDPAQLAAITLQLQAYTAELQDRVSTLEPKAEAFENLANPSLGAWSITESGKALGVQRKRLIEELVRLAWVYRKEGGDLVGYADAEARGLIEHRQVQWTGRFGADRSGLQVLITPKGLQQLSLHFTGRAGTLLERRAAPALSSPAGLLQ